VFRQFWLASVISGTSWLPMMALSVSELWVAAQRAMARLGVRSAERHSHHDLAGGDGARGRDLGFRCRDRGSKLYLHWSGGSVPDEPAANSHPHQFLLNDIESHPSCNARNWCWMRPYQSRPSWRF